MAEFLHMGGYAFYVWSSYLVVAVLLGWFFFSPLVRLQRLRNELGRDMPADTAADDSDNRPTTTGSGTTP